MQIFWIFTPNHQIVLVLANFIKPNEIYKKKTNKILTHFLTIISDLKKPWAELRPLETDHGWGPTSHYIYETVPAGTPFTRPLPLSVPVQPILEQISPAFPSTLEILCICLQTMTRRYLEIFLSHRHKNIHFLNKIITFSVLSFSDNIIHFLTVYDVVLGMRRYKKVEKTS